MQIQIHTDHHIEGAAELMRQAESLIEHAVKHFANQITRVEVHLSDENSNKSGTNDKRCMLEARLEGLQPVAVTHQATHLDQAITGAADKLKRSLENTTGRLRNR
jgi:ribosome-associated translation inhibitor RaiA